MHRLEIEGFGPFRRPQVVDFDAFAADGIFVISGRTGAGKSSILDAICFALYGSVPRYDTGEKRLRSDHSAPDDPTLVALEFSAGGERWRVERSPEYERAKRNGTGTTTAPPQARLFVWDGNGWEGRAARPRDVGEALHEILPLTQEQFLQVILLAQNRFARFLLASHGERQSLLRTLFGTRRFEEYENALELRRKDSEARLARDGDTLTHRLDEADRLIADQGLGGDAADTTDPADADTASRIEHVRQAAKRAAYRAETAALSQDAARLARDAAEVALADLLAHRDLQQRRDRARASVASLDADAARIRAVREERDAAARAELAREGIRALDVARAELEAAESDRREARAEWSALADADATDADAADANAAAAGADIEDAAGPTGAELAARIDEIKQAIGGWRVLLAREESIVERRAEYERGQAELTALTAGVDASRAEREATIVRREALDARLMELAPALGGRPAAETLVADLDARIAAATEADRLADEVAAAELTALRADRALADESASLVNLRERRLRGHAGELAEKLVPGEPCAVCGGTEHPAPAPRGDDPVSADDMDAAEARVALAVSQQRNASEALAKVRQAAAGARGKAGDRSAAQLADDRGEAARALAVIAEAERESTTLRKEREDSAQTLAALDSALAAAMPRIDSLAQELAVSAASIATDDAALAEARGKFPSVAERIADAERVATAAERLRDAIATVDRCARAERTARARADADLAEAGFETTDAAVAALRDAAARSLLDETIREHETALGAAKAVLLDLELQMLPDEPIETEAAEAARRDTRDAWTTAVQQTLAADQTRDRLDTLVRQSEAAQAGIAAALAEHETIERLAHTVAGKAPNTHRMKLETFVLAAELEEIVQAANLRLNEMSDGRYRLLHTDSLAARGAASGLGLEVLDAYTGRPRPAQSLSGGETFLASLALALGLAEVVTGRAGGIALDTLFIDEGFGSLDAETLDTAMRTLDELRQGGRTVGVISHVEAMKDQIPAQLLVEVAEDGSSEVALHAALPA
jgi:exonuclease SbcC